MHDFSTMKVAQISQLPGVADLAFKVRGLFALALQAEAKGEAQKAEEYLIKAVAAESEAAH